jgi:hypothetical protein
MLVRKASAGIEKATCDELKTVIAGGGSIREMVSSRQWGTP